MNVGISNVMLGGKPAYRSVRYYWGRRWNVFSMDEDKMEEVSVLAGATLDMFSEDTNNIIDLVIFENSLDQ